MNTAEQQQGEALPGDNFVATDDNAALPGDSLDSLAPGEGGKGADDQGDDAGDDQGQDRQYDLDTLSRIAGDDKPKTVPLSRFKEKNDQVKAEQARVRELELELARIQGRNEGAQTGKKEPAAKQEFDFDAAEDRYAAALLDGETAQAKQIRSEIRAKEREAATAEAEAAADRQYKIRRAEDDTARSNAEFALEVEKAYQAYPFLNAESEDADQDLIDETIALTHHYQRKGSAPAKALALAAARVGGRSAQAAPPAAKPDVKPDLKKGIDRAAAIPPKAEGQGERAKNLDPAKMSSADFKNMSPEDRAYFEERGL